MDDIQKLGDTPVYEHDFEDLIPAMRSKTTLYILLTLLVVIVGLTGLSLSIPCKQSLKGTAVFCADYETAIIELLPIGTGEVEEGQRVLLRTFNYPEHQYGYLKGRVAKKPHGSYHGQGVSYSVLVKLEHGWTTNRGIRLRHSLPLQGEGEIIISEKQLIEQVLAPVRNILNADKK